MSGEASPWMCQSDPTWKTLRALKSKFEPESTGAPPSVEEVLFKCCWIEDYASSSSSAFASFRSCVSKPSVNQS